MHTRQIKWWRLEDLCERGYKCVLGHHLNILKGRDISAKHWWRPLEKVACATRCFKIYYTVTKMSKPIYLSEYAVYEP